MRFGGDQYARDMACRGHLFVSEQTAFPPKECENQITAKPSASLSGVCLSLLTVGPNYVGSRLCYRRAVDDAVSLCDAPRQASAPAKTPGLWAIPHAKEPSWRWTGRASNKLMDKSTKRWMAPCKNCVKLGTHGPVQAQLGSPPAPSQALMPSSHDHWHCACTCQAMARKSSHFSCPSLAGCLGSASSSQFFLAMTIVLPPNPTFSIEVVCGPLAAPRKSSSSRGRPAVLLRAVCSPSHIFLPPIPSLDASA